MNYLVRFMITIEVTQKISAPVEQVCQVLLDHPQLERFFNAKVKTIKMQNEGELLGGKGAIRQVSIGKIVFEEEIISASDEHICYRIVGNWPVSDHQGDIQLTPLDVGNRTTQLDYVINFNGPKWLPSFLLKFFVGSDISKAMKKLAQHFASEHYSTGKCA
ncbi:MAG TPA: SRPBCC family protein [Colwellia sp.]|jgi:uncharacterized protein YndB with AHSA1/START domain|nr:SRPBCC family protein [Colwellia sp.]